MLKNMKKTSPFSEEQTAGKEQTHEQSKEKDGKSVAWVIRNHKCMEKILHGHRAGQDSLYSLLFQFLYNSGEIRSLLKAPFPAGNIMGR